MGVEQYKTRQDRQGEEDSHKTYMIRDKCAWRGCSEEHEFEEAQMVFAPIFSYYTEYKSKNDFLVFVSFDMKNENHVE